MPRESAPRPRGRVRVYHVHELPDFWVPLTDWVPNDFLYEWGAVVGNLLLRQGVNYGVGGMYLEFENVAAPGTPVAPPTFSRGPGEGVDYYNALAANPVRDYLRVPLVAGTLQSSDPVNYPKGNQPTFFAQSSGVQGVHGKPFSDANNSVVFGGALVAFVDPDDFTQDLVVSRFYLPAASQQAKLPTSQVGLEWQQEYL